MLDPTVAKYLFGPMPTVLFVMTAILIIKAAESPRSERGWWVTVAISCSVVATLLGGTPWGDAF